jgi:hypothetical protein
MLTCMLVSNLIARTMKLKIVLLLNLYGQLKPNQFLTFPSSRFTRIGKWKCNLHFMYPSAINFMRYWKTNTKNCRILYRSSMNWSTMHTVNGIILLLILLIIAMTFCGKSNQPLTKDDWVSEGVDRYIVLPSQYFGIEESCCLGLAQSSRNLLLEKCVRNMGNFRFNLIQQNDMIIIITVVIKCLFEKNRNIISMIMMTSTYCLFQINKKSITWIILTSNGNIM